MCVYNIEIDNKRYRPTRKNGFNPGIPSDDRLKKVNIPCGKCIECRKRRATDWSVRLQEDLKIKRIGEENQQLTPLFVTLTLTDESIKNIGENYNLLENNEIATKAVRLFLERYRKKFKKSLRHWLITELGEKKERIHLHGIIWSAMTKDKIEKMWNYGFVHVGSYVSARSINYMTNYATKLVQADIHFKGKVLATPGIGKDYINSVIAKRKQFNGKNTEDYYTLPNGKKVALPKYYRDKLYTEEEREQLYLIKLDEPTINIGGVEVDRNDIETIQKLKKAAAYKSERYGFIGNNKSSKYLKSYSELIDARRIKRAIRRKKKARISEYVHGERIFNNNLPENNEETQYNKNGSIQFNNWEKLEANWAS